jgi:hypothetical protein
MSNKKESVVFVGAGNVGLPTILNFALIHRCNPSRWRAFIVDFDRVEPKDIILKGYHERLVGRFKCEAAIEMVKILYGDEIASGFTPVITAAQSTPGLLHNAEAVFNAVDSTGDAAFVSAAARNAWEVRMSTGVGEDEVIHSLEVMPGGFTLGEISYDPAAWADASRHECLSGIPENIFAGVAQPLGSLTAAFAVQFFLNRNRGADDEIPFFLRVTGSEVVRSSWQGIKAFHHSSEEIPLSYDEPFGALWDEGARRLSSEVRDIRLGFPVPLVLRHCQAEGRLLPQKFERYPVRGLCQDCGGKTYCLASPRELEFMPGASCFEETLRSLHAPAGLQFQARTKTGTSAFFHLPFRLGDIPPLLEERTPEYPA